jgi:hypothetical protein
MPGYVGGLHTRASQFWSAELALRAGRTVGERLRWVVVREVDPPAFDGSDPFASALNADEVTDERRCRLCHAVIPSGVWEENGSRRTRPADYYQSAGGSARGPLSASCPTCAFFLIAAFRTS